MVCKIILSGTTNKLLWEFAAETQAHADNQYSYGLPVASTSSFVAVGGKKRGRLLTER